MNSRNNMPVVICVALLLEPPCLAFLCHYLNNQVPDTWSETEPLQKIYGPYNIIMHLHIAKLEGESEMVHGKWKQYWQWIWETLAAVYYALYSSVTVIPIPC